MYTQTNSLDGVLKFVASLAVALEANEHLTLEIKRLDAGTGTDSSGTSFGIRATSTFSRKAKTTRPAPKTESSVLVEQVALLKRIFDLRPELNAKDAAEQIGISQSGLCSLRRGVFGINQVFAKAIIAIYSPEDKIAKRLLAISSKKLRR